MAESTKLTEVPPNWDPDRWWDHVASCDACSKRYEDPRTPAPANPDEVRVDLSDLTYGVQAPVILEPRVEHLGAGDVLLLEVPAGVPASSVEAWAKQAREAMPTGVTVMVVAGEARVLRSEMAVGSEARVLRPEEILAQPGSSDPDETRPEAVGWSVFCAECGGELEQPGALAFSPPSPDDRVTKYHICRECWEWMLGTLRLLQEGGRSANVNVNLDRVLESVELAEGSPVRQETYLVQKWFESERGWGQRPDGWSLHRNREELDAYVKAYWDSMPSAAPDEYSAPDGEPRVYPGSVFTDEQIAKLDESMNGARFWGHPPEVKS